MNMLLPKQNRLRDKRWLIALRDYPCLLTGIRAHEGLSIVPHHLQSGRGSLGMKSADDQAIPLRQDLHCLIDHQYPTELHLVRDYLSDDLLADMLRVYARHLYAEWKR